MDQNDKPIVSFPLIPGDDTCLYMGDNWLFHYTTAESFFKIIKSLKLKTARLGKLNDLNEINDEAYSMMLMPEMVKYKEYVEKGKAKKEYCHNPVRKIGVQERLRLIEEEMSDPNKTPEEITDLLEIYYELSSDDYSFDDTKKKR